MYDYLARNGLTCSFGMSATASGLLGWTPSEVTEGHPFWLAVSRRQRAIPTCAHFVHIHLLAISMCDEPVEVV